MKVYYTAKDAAAFVGIGLRAMREAMASGEVPCERDGNAYLAEEGDLRRYRAKLRAEGRRFKAGAK